MNEHKKKIKLNKLIMLYLKLYYKKKHFLFNILFLINQINVFLQCKSIEITISKRSV